MTKPFDYSKWDNIELSDDEDDCHPNIDKESWFRMKHRSRVEREENEEKDKAVIVAAMHKANQRIAVLQHDLAKINTQRAQAAVDGSDDSEDDEDLDDREGLEAELKQLQKENAERQAKLDEYEKHKKWNIDNMFQVKDERTLVNPNAGKETFTPTGFVVDKVAATKPTVESDAKPAAKNTEPVTATASKAAPTPAAKPAPKAEAAAAAPKPAAAPAPPKPAPKPAGPTKPDEPSTNHFSGDIGAMETYAEFTEKYAETVEEFMTCKTLDQSKNFLLRNADVLLQENASNYLLLASLEDEMNGHRDKMKLTARQSQIISNIAELAKTVGTHPGNVIQPFFQRLSERKHLEDFLQGVTAFQDKIVTRAVVKKAEMDEQRRQSEQSTNLDEVPREQRLGPGGLDPLEVIETLPDALVEAFESRDVDQLREALLQMDPAEAEYHMKRCTDSGLWVANAGDAAAAAAAG